jgi:hypothetical protein
MISDNDRFVSSFGRVAQGDKTELAAVVAKAVRDGFAVVLCKPGTKQPVCTLTTPRTKAKADREAREAAKAAGNPRWDKIDHDCGLKHALTDPDKAKTVYTRVQAQYTEPLNIAIEPRQSRMVCIDVDSPTELEGFLTDWSVATNQIWPISEEPQLTVQSPGAKNAEGEWVHKDGGHFWFEVPEGVELPLGVGKYKAPSGWVMMWGENYALVPPSRRPEGVYQFKSPEIEFVPGWLVELMDRGEPDRPVAPEKDPDDPVDQWAANTPWAELLGQGSRVGLPNHQTWTELARTDRCGCPMWTAPGNHDDPKSATAHEPGCTKTNTETGHGPLHIWTDNPPEWLAERRNYTKLQYLAARDHGGNVAAAMRDLGLEPTLAGVPEAEVFDPAAELDGAEPYRWVDLGPYIDGSIVNPQPSVGATRVDGALMLYPTKWHTVIGLTTAGKSWFALWHCLEILAQGGTCVYLHFEEQTPVNTIARLRQLGADMDAVKARFVWLHNERAWKAGELGYTLDHLGLNPDLVVLDGINAACSGHGWKVNDTEAVGLYRAMFVNPAEKRGAAVLSLGHPVKDRSRQDEIHSFGSTAWLDEVDGCSFRLVASTAPIRRKHEGSSAVSVVKDRAGEVAARCQLSTDKSEPWYYFGQFRVDDSITDLEGAHLTSIVLSNPVDTEDGDLDEEIDPRAERVLQVLRERGGEYTSANELHTWLLAAQPPVKIKMEALKVVLVQLEDAGKITRWAGPNRSQPGRIVEG